MKYIILIPLYIYRFILSPILVSVLGPACRFNPTCSEYSIESINRYGVFRGIALSLKRLAKCHSWS